MDPRGEGDDASGVQDALPQEEQEEEEGALEMRVVEGIEGAEAVALLGGAVWGTEGVLCRLLGLPDLLRRIASRHAPACTLECRRRGSGELLGLACVCAGDAPEAHAPYLFCFASRGRAAAHGIGAAVMTEGVRLYREAVAATPADALPTVLWLVVDRDNARSLKRVRLMPGVVHVRTTRVLVGCYALPRRSARVTPLRDAAELRRVQQRLREQWAASGTVDLCPAATLEGYRVVRDPATGDVLAGAELLDVVCAYPERFARWVESACWAAARWLGPLMPMYAGDGSARMLGQSSPLCERGREAELWALFEAAQAERGASMVTLGMDTRCEMYGRLLLHAQGSGAWGAYGGTLTSSWVPWELFAAPVRDGAAGASAGAFVEKLLTTPFVAPYHIW
eukprot:m51a1_g11596 hypothetical protein (395) ;mRNA; r:113323-114889